MRNWGTIVTGFYILIVAGLSPVFGLFALNIGDRPLFEHLDWYLDPASWRYWSAVALLGGGPLVLFVVGVDTSRRRLKPRRHILVSAAAAGLALTLLVVAVIANVIMAIPAQRTVRHRSLRRYPQLDHPRGLPGLLATLGARALADGRAASRSGDACLPLAGGGQRARIADRASVACDRASTQ